MQPLPPIQNITAASLTGFDWFLVILVAASVISSFMRGIIKAIFSLCGLIFGIIVASWNYYALADVLHRRWIYSFGFAQVIAFAVILILVLFLFSLAARLLSRTAAAVGLGFFDRLLGAVFGLFRGILFGVAIMMAMAAFIPHSIWVPNSRLAPYFLAGAHAVSFVVPRRFEEQISSGAAHLLQQSPGFFTPHTPTQHR